MKYSRFELCHGLHRVLDGRLAVHAVKVEQVDAVDAETLQATFARFFDVLGVAAEEEFHVGRAELALDDATEFSGQENLVTFARPLEPLSKEIFRVTLP